MRVDASLVSILLAATASAQHSYNATHGYNSTANGHLISELEKEVQELRHKLEAATAAASQTCEAHQGQGAPSYGQSGAPGASSSNGASAASPVNGQSGASAAPSGSAGSPAGPQGYNGQSGAAAPSSAANAGVASSSDSNPPGYYIHTGYGYPSDAPHSEGGAAQTQPAGYAPQNEGVSTPAAQATQGAANGASAQQPAVSDAGFGGATSAAGYMGSAYGFASTMSAGAAPSEGASGASSGAAGSPAGYGSSAAPVVSSASAYTTPDYYAPLPPAETDSTSTYTSTKTVIVTAGTITVSESQPTATESSESGVYTCTETYHGSAPIPSPPVSTSDAASASASVSSVISSLSSAISQGISSSAPYGYGNGTGSGYPSGSSGFLTGTVKSPVPSGTGAASLTFACNPAHSYPGASCISTAGSLTLVTPSASATSPVASGIASNGTSSGIVGTGSAPITTTSSVASGIAGNSTTSGVASGTGSAIISAKPTVSANSTSTSTSSSASASATAIDCSAICSTATKFNDWDVTPLTCTQLKAGTSVNTPTGQSSVGCAASFTPSLDICQITLNVKTAGQANTYMEVWLPNGNTTAWNGRSINTDNGGLNGCVHYVDMQYVSGLGFAAIGDNAGHNGSSFDGTWTMNNNQAIVDWAYRARHAAVDVGKQVIDTFYSKKPEYSYYIGCSAGGAQGLQSAQKYPNDFDGIIAGASANDFNHLQDWSAHFRQLTGASGNDTFLTVNDWTLVQSYILDQCDEKLDGVNDGILEDPTICDFDVSAIPVCSASTTSGCLNATQIETVTEAFKPLYNAQGALIYPPLLYGAQVDAFRLGLLSGSIQGIAQDFFRGAVYNNSAFDILTINQQDYARADELDDMHGNPSAFNGDLSGLQGAGGKLIMYHGMADPMTSGYNSQRYYQKVAKTMGTSNVALDEFFRFFRISGMAHCGVGGISGAGAWMFGQSGAAASASNNIVRDLQAWVEKGDAPEVMTGTKFWYDTPSLGVEFERPHCRYPYRTTYVGGDSTKPEAWTCKFIDNWQDCEDVTCSKDGTFT